MKYLLISLVLGTSIISSGCSTLGLSGKKYDSDSIFTQGVEAYQARQYDRAKTLLSKAAYQNLPQSKLIETSKNLAFIHALQGNKILAIQHFLKCFELDHDFELDKAELGHPAWTPAYEEAQRQASVKYASANDLFEQGKDAYTKRNYTEAESLLLSAVGKTELKKDRKVEAHKFLAFIFAVQQRSGDARAQFRRAFELDKNFKLDKAEYGNPVWTPLYEAVKKEFVK